MAAPGVQRDGSRPESPYRAERTPTPRRVRAQQNAHGAYLLSQLRRSNSRPLYWGAAYGHVAQPPRVLRTSPQLHAFMVYVRRNWEEMS